MSMLSAQCDELRVLADELRQIKDHNVDWLHMEAVTLASSADAMREAADTIESLRDRLQDVALDSRCTNLRADSEHDEFECSECGHVDGPYCYAPEVGEHCKGCGREVVER